jgi:hypothetical protein
MKKPVLLAFLLAAVILGVLIYSSMNLAKYRVEVCMDFHGLQNCKTAAGATREFALRTATTNACAAIASGVTDSIGCENTPPTKVTWK